MGFVKNLDKTLASLDVEMRRINQYGVAVYRRWVWALLIRLMEQTPQYSGKAVANWNVSLDAPDYSVDHTVGDDLVMGPSGGGEFTARPEGGSRQVRQKGDRTWIEYNLTRHRWIVDTALIQRNSRVFIANGVTGDDDGGWASELYLQQLQDPAYWQLKLRAVNQPYETVQETLALFSWADVEKVRFTGDYTRIRK